MEALLAVQEADSAGGSLSVDSICFLRDNMVQIGASITLEDSEQSVSLQCSCTPLLVCLLHDVQEECFDICTTSSRIKSCLEDNKQLRVCKYR